MAIAFDAFGNGTEGTGSISYTHTPVGTPRGVVVLVVQQGADDHVSGVTYGGTAMTEATLSPLAKATGENGSVYCYWLGASVPTGAQTVAMTSTGASEKNVFSITVTANADIELVDTTTISSDSLENPSATLSLGGISCFCAEAFFAGPNATTSITPFANWTSRFEEVAGGGNSATRACYTYDVIGTTDVTMGWTQSADDAIGFGIAIREAATATTVLRQINNAYFT